MEKENGDKSYIAVIIGFLLIGLIGVMTFFRPNLSKEKKSEIAVSENESSPEKDTLVTSPENLVKKISTSEELILLDIRDHESFQKEHLLDSKNIPATEIPQWMASSDKSKEYILIDELGGEDISSLVKNFFKENGFSETSYLAGGVSAWKSKGNQLISDGDPTVFSDQAKVSYIKTDDLKDMIIAGEDLFLIDLRKSNTYADGHIPGAMNIFLEDLEQKRREIPMGKKIVLYDNDGLWAFKGAVRLFDAGVFNVFAISDGLDEWKKKGYEIVK